MFVLLLLYLAGVLLGCRFWSSCWSIGYGFLGLVIPSTSVLALDAMARGPGPRRR